jgi:chemotaxis protein methyltransferase CheR
MGVFTEEQHLSDDLFSKFSSLIHRSCGIFLPPPKKVMLTARLNKRLRALGLSSFEDYFRYLQKETAAELSFFINTVTTNTTEFFREAGHFRFLKEIALPSLNFYPNAPLKRVPKVWSAACATGEEPYSLAMTLFDYFDRPTFDVIATDIDTDVLDRAQKGIYPEGATANIPESLSRRFTMKGIGKFQGYRRIVPEIRGRIQFSAHNFLHDVSPTDELMDIIFCRNVFIYFDTATRMRVVRKLFRHLHPQGYLFIGYSESLSDISKDFQGVAPAVYVKK